MTLAALQGATYPHSSEELTLAVGLPAASPEVYPVFRRLTEPGVLEASAKTLRFLNLHVLAAAFAYQTRGESLN